MAFHLLLLSFHLLLLLSFQMQMFHAGWWRLHQLRCLILQLVFDCSCSS